MFDAVNVIPLPACPAPARAPSVSLSVRPSVCPRGAVEMGVVISSNILFRTATLAWCRLYDLTLNGLGRVDYIHSGIALQSVPKRRTNEFLVLHVYENESASISYAKDNGMVTRL